jgi:hypothetical protein
MALNIPNHQYAGDARVPFAFGGRGDGSVKIDQLWAVANLTAGSRQLVYKVLKDGWIGNFSIKASNSMDTHASQTLTWDVGVFQGVTATDADEYMAAVTNVEALAGHGTNEIAETTEVGSRVVAGDYISVTAKANSATAVAGTISLSFQFFAD